MNEPTKCIVLLHNSLLEELVIVIY